MDITLGVTVISAADTLLVFRPKFPHGTTLARPEIYRAGIAITFSTHIRTAFQKAMANLDRGIVVEQQPIAPELGKSSDSATF